METRPAPGSLRKDRRRAQPRSKPVRASERGRQL